MTLSSPWFIRFSLTLLSLSALSPSLSHAREDLPSKEEETNTLFNQALQQLKTIEEETTLLLSTSQATVQKEPEEASLSLPENDEASPKTVTFDPTPPTVFLFNTTPLEEEKKEEKKPTGTKKKFWHRKSKSTSSSDSSELDPSLEETKKKNKKNWNPFKSRKNKTEMDPSEQPSDQEKRKFVALKEKISRYKKGSALQASLSPQLQENPPVLDSQGTDLLVPSTDRDEDQAIFVPDLDLDITLSTQPEEKTQVSLSLQDSLETILEEVRQLSSVLPLPDKGKETENPQNSKKLLKKEKEQTDLLETPNPSLSDLLKTSPEEKEENITLLPVITPPTAPITPPTAPVIPTKVSTPFPHPMTPASTPASLPSSSPARGIGATAISLISTGIFDALWGAKIQSYITGYYEKLGPSWKLFASHTDPKASWSFLRKTLRNIGDSSLVNARNAGWAGRMGGDLLVGSLVWITSYWTLPQISHSFK